MQYNYNHLPSQSIYPLCPTNQQLSTPFSQPPKAAKPPTLLCDIIDRQFETFMSSTKRSLRERRTPRNFDSDNEDPDPYGYSKHTYTRVNGPPAQELRNPTLQLNSDAKLLVKFLSSINKCYKDYEQENRKKEIESIKEPLPVRERKSKPAETAQESGKRASEGLKESRNQSSRKSKEPYNFKAQGNNSDGAKNQKSDAFLNRIKNMTMESASSMIHLERSLGKARQPPSGDQLVQMAKKMVKFMDENQQRTLISDNSKNDACNNFFYSNDKAKNAKIALMQAKFGIPKSTFNESKLFKRSSFHVGIAYHIYFKKLLEKGVTNVEMDPTYNARKLREEMKK